ncbi:MAG: MmgE/PrpD family protein [Deltaproteobacteria bacterium]|nr:MmgE/PrpD family protein [Deltaproteobacteria bacterium]
MEVLTKLIDLLAETEFNDLSYEVVENTKKFILDSLGVAIAGSSAPGCKEVVGLMKEWGGRPEATIMVYGGKVPSPFAVLANSTMMHALDFDDTLDESALHAYASVLPTALAMAETRGDVSGKDLINAVTLGVDLVCRLGLAIKRPLSWIRTSTCGSFGAAATAAKILGLDREKMLNTLGIVYSQTSGNAQCLIDGGLTKRMQPAFSAKAGAFSVLLAQRGITGARDIFEGEHGFFNLYERGEWDRGPLLDGLGKRFEGMRLSIKPYPSCRMTHAAIDAALEIVKKHKIGPTSIKRVVVYTSKMAKEMVGSHFEIRTDPQVDAQFSIPYTVSVALMRGDVFLKDFQDSAIRDKGVLEMAKKVEVQADPAIEERSLMKASILIETRDNQSYSYDISAPRGNPQRPMSIDECKTKYYKCVQFSGNKALLEKTDALIDCVTHLEDVKDVTTITELLV